MLWHKREIFLKSAPNKCSAKYLRIWRVSGFSMILSFALIIGVLFLDFLESNSGSYDTSDSGYVQGLALTVLFFLISLVHTLVVLTPLAFYLNRRNKLTYWRFQLLSLLISILLINAILLFPVIVAVGFFSLGSFALTLFILNTLIPVACVIFGNIWWLLSRLDFWLNRRS